MVTRFSPPRRVINPLGREPSGEEETGENIRGVSRFDASVEVCLAARRLDAKLPRDELSARTNFGKKLPRRERKRRRACVRSLLRLFVRNTRRRFRRDAERA